MAKRGKKHLTALQLMREIAKKVGGKKVTNLREIDDEIGWEEWGEADTVAGFVAGNVTIVVADWYTPPRYTDYWAEDEFHRMNVGVFDTTDPTKAGKKNNIDRESDTDEETILTWAQDAMKGEFEDNPVHQLRVTAPTEAKAKTKARKFGRIIDVRHRGGDQYAVKVHQNPELPIVEIPMSMGRPPLQLKTDKEIREWIGELRAEVQNLKRSAKSTRERAKQEDDPQWHYWQYGGPDPAGWIVDAIEVKEAEIERFTNVLKRRKALRKAEREGKKLPKTPVMRRRKGVVTRINNPKRAKNVRGLVRKALS